MKLSRALRKFADAAAAAARVASFVAWAVIASHSGASAQGADAQALAAGTGTAPIRDVVLPSPTLIALAYWAPLVALLVLSLGLIALKRVSQLPPWVRRLVVPPFYVVSLPVAALLAGADMLSCMLWFVYQAFVNLLMGDWHLLLEDWRYVPGLILLMLHAIFRMYRAKLFWSGICFAVALVISGRSLWRTLWHEHGRECSSSRTRHYLRALLLVLAFVCPWLILRIFILDLLTDSAGFDVAFMLFLGEFAH
jgi:hypothetical protein